MRYSKIFLGVATTFLSLSAYAASTYTPPTCGDGEQLVTKKYTPSSVFAYDKNSTVTSDIFYADFSFDKNLTQDINSLYVVAQFSNERKYDYHGFYVVQKRSNIITGKNTFAATFNYMSLDLRSDVYTEDLKDGNINIGISHTNPNGVFKEWVYLNNVTVGFCSKPVVGTQVDLDASVYNLSNTVPYTYTLTTGVTYQAQISGDVKDAQGKDIDSVVATYMDPKTGKHEVKTIKEGDKVYLTTDGELNFTYPVETATGSHTVTFQRVND